MLTAERKTRIAVLVSGGGTNLQALIDAQRASELPHGELVLVISNKENVLALTRAKEAGIPAKSLVVADFPSFEAWEEAMFAALDAAGVELIILAGFLEILSKRFTDRYPERILNIHPSLIPAFAGPGFYGLHVHEAALARGVKLTGATVHFVNEITDGGPILLQKTVRVRKNDTPETLQQRVMRQAEWVLLPRAAELVSRRLAAERKNQGGKR